MVADRSANGGHRRATDPPLEAQPAEAAAQMEEATQRLRERAWMLNATTSMPGSAMTSAMDAVSLD